MAFNIRVYGIMLQDEYILVSDEIIQGKCYTKFPGGGLEFGEGTRDCLKRELMEELQWKVEVGNHIYTTDYFQPSAFNDDQIIAVYYYAHPLEDKTLQRSDEALFGGIENFRWHSIHNIHKDSVSLPIDKIVLQIVLDTVKAH